MGFCQQGKIHVFGYLNFVPKSQVNISHEENLAQIFILVESGRMKDVGGKWVLVVKL